MSALVQVGSCRLQVLDASGAVSQAVTLPAPSRGEPTLKWERRGSRVELLDGSERSRVLGWLPVLTMAWTTYPEDPAPLLDLLGRTPPGRLRVSPGPSAGWLTVGEVQAEALRPNGPWVQGLKITFRGRSVLPSMVLEAE